MLWLRRQLFLYFSVSLCNSNLCLKSLICKYRSLNLSFISYLFCIENCVPAVVTWIFSMCFYILSVNWTYYHAFILLNNLIPLCTVIPCLPEKKVNVTHQISPCNEVASYYGPGAPRIFLSLALTAKREILLVFHCVLLAAAVLNLRIFHLRIL